jgi:hypothetical protein
MIPTKEKDLKGSPLTIDNNYWHGFEKITKNTYVVDEYNNFKWAVVFSPKEFQEEVMIETLSQVLISVEFFDTQVFEYHPNLGRTSIQFEGDCAGVFWRKAYVKENYGFYRPKSKYDEEENAVKLLNYYKALSENVINPTDHVFKHFSHQYIQNLDTKVFFPNLELIKRMMQIYLELHYRIWIAHLVHVYT